jgi:hypothetical protein
MTQSNLKPFLKDSEEYFQYWESKGYEFIESRTIDTKTGFTKFVWIKKKVNKIL